jgi:hypothetical protein
VQRCGLDENGLCGRHDVWELSNGKKWKLEGLRSARCIVISFDDPSSRDRRRCKSSRLSRGTDMSISVVSRK